MKPIRLEMTAFGPYSRTVILDFTSLADRSMFLITGPTGAGKTSILDAMVYALYGQTSGGLRDGADMRSDYADGEVATRVSFEFALGGKDYRIDRAPRQTLKKLRGTGTKEEQASATLYIKKADAWQEISSRSSEIKSRVTEIIGFRAEQFLQVVLLPQGDFRKLLLASTAERESIMHTLFRTEIYRRLQELLKEEMQEARRQCEDVLQARRAVLAAAGAETEEDLETALTDAAKEAANVSYQLEKRRAVLTVLEERWRLLTAQQKLGERLNEAKVKLQSLSEQQKEIDEQRKLITVLRRLEPLLLKQKRQAELAGELTEAEKTNSLWKKELQSLQRTAERLQQEQKDQESRKPAYDRQKEELQRLTGQLERLTELEERRQEENRFIKELAMTETAEKTVADELLTGQEALRRLKTNMALTDELLRTEPAVTEQRLKGESEAKLLNRFAEGQQAWTEGQARYKESCALSQKGELKAAQTRQQWEQVKHLHELGQAYLLAEQLQTGKPCPVCGSPVHPAPAVQKELLVREEEVLQAEQLYLATYESWQEQRREETRCHDQVKRQEEELQRLVQEAGLAWQDRLTLQVEARRQKLAEEAAALQEQMKKLEQAKQDRTEMGEKEIALEQENRNKEGQRSDLSRKISDLRVHLEGLRSAAAVLSKDMPAESEGRPEKLKKQQEALQAAIKDFDRETAALAKQVQDNSQSLAAVGARLGEGEKNAAELAVRLLAVQKDYEQELTHQQLPEQELPGLIEQQPKLQAYEAQAAAYDDEVSRASAVAAALEGQLAESREQSDRLARSDEKAEEPTQELTQEILEQAQAQQTELVNELARTKARQKSLEQNRDTLKGLLEKDKAKTERYTFIYRLYDLANGGQTGLRGVTFERYVLGAILEEVATAANLRLSEMSRGRYELCRSAELGGRGSQGLDLDVFDSYTGYARPAGTLSGGETFLASLSLALGLADVVQSYAGGIHLDTIFIDEGFGTLDPDTLDTALQVLIELQKSGRLVGIISHVPELRQRIPDQLTVTKTDQGSTAAFQLH